MSGFHRWGHTAFHGAEPPWSGQVAAGLEGWRAGGLVHNKSVIRKHIVVHGQVQGVGFRYSARAQASRLGLVGYARNRPDGAVEVEVEGDEASVGQMLVWIQSGPRSAVVESVDVWDLNLIGEAGFRISF